MYPRENQASPYPYLLYSANCVSNHSFPHEPCAALSMITQTFHLVANLVVWCAFTYVRSCIPCFPSPLLGYHHHLLISLTASFLLTWTDLETSSHDRRSPARTSGKDFFLRFAFGQTSLPQNFLTSFLSVCSPLFCFHVVLCIVLSVLHVIAPLFYFLFYFVPTAGAKLLDASGYRTAWRKRVTSERFSRRRPGIVFVGTGASQEFVLFYSSLRMGDPT